MPLAWAPYTDRAEAERRLNGIPAGLELDFYRADGDEFPGSLDEVAFYVLPYMKGPAVLDRAADMPKLQVVQTLTAGYEEFLPLVPPGVTLCNAAGLHDTSTAELALALALASGRHLDDFARNQTSGAWRFEFRRALADQRVLIIRDGHIRPAIEYRLDRVEVASGTPGAPRGPADGRAAEPLPGGPAAGEHRQAGLGRGQLGVTAVAGQQARVVAGLDDAAVVQHDDLIGVADGGQPVRDGDGGAAPGQGVERLLHGPFGLGVQRAGGLVEHEHARIAQQGPGDGDALLFPAGEAVPARSDHGVVA